MDQESGNGRWQRTQLDGTRMDSITADNVEVHRSAVRSVNAHEVELERSAVQRLSADTVETERTAVANLRSGTVTLQESAAGLVVAQNAAVDRSRVFVLASPVVRGNVSALIDLRSGFAIGLGLVVGRLLVRLLSRSAR